MRVECCGIPLKPKLGLTPISCHAVLERSAYAPFITERRMECINATSLHRKSGQWGTQRSLTMKQCKKDFYGGPSEFAFEQETKAGFPFQAVFWLEWDSTALSRFSSKMGPFTC